MAATNAIFAGIACRESPRIPESRLAVPYVTYVHIPDVPFTRRVIHRLAALYRAVALDTQNRYAGLATGPLRVKRYVVQHHGIEAEVMCANDRHLFERIFPSCGGNKHPQRNSPYRRYLVLSRIRAIHIARTYFDKQRTTTACAHHAMHRFRRTSRFHRAFLRPS
jgi:hypothetical protein